MSNLVCVFVRRFYGLWVLVALVFAALGLTEGSARGAIVLDNLAPGGGATSSDKSFVNIAGWGERFTATDSGDVTNLKVNLYRTNTQSGAYSLELWDGGATTPGSLLVTLKTLDWSNVPLNSTTTNTAAYVEVTTFDNTYSIVSGTSYWLVVKQPANGPAAKRWTVTGSGMQAASFNANTSLWTNVGTGSNLGAQITVSSVPEPSTCAMALAGLVCGGCVILRRRNRAAS